jgi:hypothetical protein
VRITLGVGAILILIALTVITTGCASWGFYQMSDEWCDEHPQASAARCAGRTDAPPNPAQSWDQEHLKRGDAGCPTAVYIAPEGNLVECGP